VYQADDQRSGTSVAVNHEENQWFMETDATDNLTNDIGHLNVHGRYHGRDQVQVANGVGLSIMHHVDHSPLDGSLSFLDVENILQFSNIRNFLLSVYRIVSANNITINFIFSLSRTRL
jgi:hypothetical protein